MRPHSRFRPTKTFSMPASLQRWESLAAPALVAIFPPSCAAGIRTFPRWLGLQLPSVYGPQIARNTPTPLPGNAWSDIGCTLRETSPWLHFTPTRMRPSIYSCWASTVQNRAQHWNSLLARARTQIPQPISMNRCLGTSEGPLYGAVPFGSIVAFWPHPPVSGLLPNRRTRREIRDRAEPVAIEPHSPDSAPPPAAQRGGRSTVRRSILRPCSGRGPPPAGRSPESACERCVAPQITMIRSRPQPGDAAAASAAASLAGESASQCGRADAPGAARAAPAPPARPPPANSAIIFWLNAGMSSGLRLETRP